MTLLLWQSIPHGLKPFRKYPNNTVFEEAEARQREVDLERQWSQNTWNY